MDSNHLDFMLRSLFSLPSANQLLFSADRRGGGQSAKSSSMHFQGHLSTGPPRELHSSQEPS
jgi:hypothetical protein